MDLPRLAAEPEWKQYLRLGEQLLNQPDASAQCRLIEQSLHNLLGCQATVWLAHPFYPLPGQSKTPTLPHPQASELVSAAFSRKQIVHRSAPENPSLPQKDQKTTAGQLFHL